MVNTKATARRGDYVKIVTGGNVITCGECRHHIRQKHFIKDDGYCDNYDHNETFKSCTGLRKYVLFSINHKCVYGVRRSN
jgi:hypothetical protein